jgi:hypothetical protein
MRFSSNGYFFFFLAFFAFFAFFAFLAMLPSVVPKVGSMQVDIDMHSFRLHHDCKIDTASFKEGKRPPHPRSEEEADHGKPGHPLARSTVYQSKATARRAFAGRGLHYRYEQQRHVCQRQQTDMPPQSPRVRC